MAEYFLVYIRRSSTFYEFPPTQLGLRYGGKCTADYENELALSPGVDAVNLVV